MMEITRIMIPVLILAVSVVFLWQLWKMKQEKKAGFTVKDERTTRIEGKAAKITVHVIGFFMLSLLFYYIFADKIVDITPVLEIGWALIISVTFNSLLYNGQIFYFRRCED